MITLSVLVTLLREVLRTLATPVRLLLYLPRRHHWRRVAREVLDAAAHAPAGGGDAGADDAVLAQLVARARERASCCPGSAPTVFVSAGEASGEAHAAALVRRLQELPGGPVRVRAFGGAPLREAGAEVLYPLSEHAVMGFFAVLGQLPQILRAFAAFLRMLRADPPDLVVLVDYPGLHVVMAKACRRRRVPVLHYVAPQYWAWGPWRMRRYRRAVDATLTILPFETAFFRRFAVPARYIGHPLLDQLAAHPPAPADVAAARARPTLCLLPGSRRSEIAANLPGMVRVARALRAEHQDLRVVLPHRDPRRTELLRQLLQELGADFVEHREGALAPWLAGARLVLAKSGTGSLEACLFGNPVIVVYQLRSLLNALGYHNILSVPFIAAANLIAGRRVVPEHCFRGDGGWDRVLHDARALWRDGPERARCTSDLREVRRRLGEPGATARVAQLVRQVLDHGEDRR
ncbi:MAG: lipid-A-disaccharide synthase [Planctomycetota bacterium]